MIRVPALRVYDSPLHFPVMAGTTIGADNFPWFRFDSLAAIPTESLFRFKDSESTSRWWPTHFYPLRRSLLPRLISYSAFRNHLG